MKSLFNDDSERFTRRKNILISLYLDRAKPNFATHPDPLLPGSMLLSTRLAERIPLSEPFHFQESFYGNGRK